MASRGSRIQDKLIVQRWPEQPLVAKRVNPFVPGQTFQPFDRRGFVRQRVIGPIVGASGALRLFDPTVDSVGSIVAQAVAVCDVADEIDVDVPSVERLAGWMVDAMVPWEIASAVIDELLYDDASASPEMTRTCH